MIHMQHKYNESPEKGKRWDRGVTVYRSNTVMWKSEEILLYHVPFMRFVKLYFMVDLSLNSHLMTPSLSITVTY